MKRSLVNKLIRLEQLQYDALLHQLADSKENVEKSRSLVRVLGDFLVDAKRNVGRDRVYSGISGSNSEQFCSQLHRKLEIVRCGYEQAQADLMKLSQQAASKRYRLDRMKVYLERS